MKNILIAFIIIAASFFHVSIHSPANAGQEARDYIEKFNKEIHDKIIDSIVKDLQNGDYTKAQMKATLAGIILQFVPETTGTAMVEVTMAAMGAGPAAKPVSKVIIKTAKKIEKAMPKRGWSKADIESTVSNPKKTIETKDHRRNKGGDTNNDPATAYFDKDNNYVVINDTTGDVVQISDKNKKDWKSPFD